MAEISGVINSKGSIGGQVTVKMPLSGLVTGGNKQIRELRFLPLSEFPEVGRIEVLYIDTTGNQTYYWDGAMYRILSQPDYEIVAHTTAEWNAMPSYQSKSGSIYIYTDYTVESEKTIPAVKIGDGMAYVVDLPMLTAVTEADRQRWDNKVSAAISPIDPENLVLYTSESLELTIGG